MNKLVCHNLVCMILLQRNTQPPVAIGTVWITLTLLQYSECKWLFSVVKQEYKVLLLECGLTCGWTAFIDFPFNAQQNINE